MSKTKRLRLTVTSRFGLSTKIETCRFGNTNHSVTFLTSVNRFSLQHGHRYIEHYSQWLPPQHYYIAEVKLALAQLIGAGGPTSIQTISEEKLNLKIELCQQLLKLFSVIAAGEGSPFHFQLIVCKMFDRII